MKHVRTIDRVAMWILVMAVGTPGWSQTTWKAAVNGDWIEADNWTGGVPDNTAANLTPDTASYTVTVNAAPDNAFTDLTIANGVGYTTALDLNAAEFRSADGVMTLGRGAVVNVNAGGVVHYTGSDSTKTILSIRDGGVLRVDGGAAAFTNLYPAGATAARYKYINVGDYSSGSLLISGGSCDIKTDLSTANQFVHLRIGYGAGGAGLLAMTGGSMTIAVPGSGSTLLVGETSSTGEFLLTNSASLSITNWAVIGGWNGTGRGTLAGESSMKVRGRFMFGNGTPSYGALTVKDQATLDVVGAWYLGGYNYSGGTGILNVAGGTVRQSTSGSLHVGYANNATARSFGQVNVSGGFLEVNNYMYLGVPAAAGYRGYGELNVSGGSVYTRWLLSAGAFGGAGREAVGVINISNGAITNDGEFVVGKFAGGTGTVHQTGGRVYHRGAGSQIYYQWIGRDGGNGSYTLENGQFLSDRDVFVGGKTGETSASIGRLRMTGGTFTLNSKDLYVAQNGQGSVRLGGGALSVRNLNLASSGATLGFDAPSGSFGSCVVTGTMTIDPGAKLEVDASGAVPGVRHTLVACGTRNTDFAAGNITVIGGDTRWIDQDTDTNIYVYKPAGTMISVR